MTPSAKLYRDAVEVLRTRGHAKGTLKDNNGCVCLLDALNAAAFGGPTVWHVPGTRFPNLTDVWSRVGDDLAKHLPEVLTPKVATVPDPLSRVVTWNDEDERTADDIINLFERAAKAQEEAKQ